MITDCIRDALEAGFVRKDKAEEAVKAYDELVESGVDPIVAAEKMKRAVKSAKIAERTAAIKRAKLTFDYDKRISELDRDQTYKFLPEILNSVFVKANTAYKGILHKKLADFIEASNVKYAGTWRPTDHIEDVVRALYGEDARPEAKKMAEGVKEMTDFVADIMRTMGVYVEKDPDFRLPQTHSKVKMADKEQWVNDHMEDGVLDWDKMSEFNDDKPIPTDASKRRAILEDVWLTLSSNGSNKKVKAGAKSGALAIKFAHRRFLRYANADSWIKMQKLYGEGDAFQGIIRYADTAAHDIAMADAFGPAPRSMFEYVKAGVERRATELGSKGAKAKGTLLANTVTKKPLEADIKSVHATASDMFEILSHSDASVEGDLFARGMQSARTLIVSAFLGGTGVLASVTDNLSAVFSRWHDNSSSGRYLTQYLRLMNPASDADRRIALRSGLAFDAATKAAAGAERYFGEIFAPQWIRRVSDVAMRANLLTPHTQSAQWAHSLEFMGTMADHAGSKLDDLPFKEILGEYNITAKDWDDFRQGQIFNEGWFHMLRPADLFERADLPPERQAELFGKFSTMMYTQREFAIPTQNLRGEAQLRGRARAGTLPGELVLSAKMFKSFPFTLLNTHFRRARDMGLVKGTGYLAGYGLVLTAGGAMANQLLAISQGRDPEQMDQTFWARSLLKGGGLGIFGDFFFSDLNRHGGGLMRTFSGPIVQLLDDTRNLTFGNMMELIEGEDTNFIAELQRYAERYAPAVNAAPYALVLQRMVLDQLQEVADPEAYSRWRRQERKMRQERGSEFWWKPGETAPRRGPDLESALPDSLR